MKTKRNKDEKSLSVRMPTNLLEKLRVLAIQDNRSLNSQIVHILQQSTKDVTIEKEIK